MTARQGRDEGSADRRIDAKRDSPALHSGETPRPNKTWHRQHRDIDHSGARTSRPRHKSFEGRSSPLQMTALPPDVLVDELLESTRMRRSSNLATGKSASTAWRRKQQARETAGRSCRRPNLSAAAEWNHVAPGSLLASSGTNAAQAPRLNLQRTCSTMLL